jgi:hypothetical protein
MHGWFFSSLSLEAQQVFEILLMYLALSTLTPPISIHAVMTLHYKFYRDLTYKVYWKFSIIC